MSDRFTLEIDSTDYDVLFRGVLSMTHANGIICEIGTRKGGSLVCIIDALLQKQDYNRNVLSIDPYGEIAYRTAEGLLSTDPNYLFSNTLRNEAMVGLHHYVLDKPVNLVFMALEDTEFFARFADGVPFYQKNKTVLSKYSLVFFDGPHTTADVLQETLWFIPRTEQGSVFVYDDVTGYYDHNLVETIIQNEGFVLLEKTAKKASYIRK